MGFAVEMEMLLEDRMLILRKSFVLAQLRMKMGQMPGYERKIARLGRVCGGG